MAKNTEPASKLTTREVTDSRLLMIMIAAGKPSGKSRTVERVVKTVEAELHGKNAELPVYDVRVSINGIDLDFRDFAAEVQRQLDDMVMHQAGELLKQTVGDKLDLLAADAHESLQRLNEGVQKRAADLLGYNPWQDT